jgi:hypothetical protein
MYFKFGALAFVPDKLEPDTNRESDAMTYTGVHCLDVIFKWGMLTLSTMLDNLISTLEYIYSILDKVIYFNRNNFQGSTKPLFTSQNRMEIS